VSDTKFKLIQIRHFCSSVGKRGTKPEKAEIMRMCILGFPQCQSVNRLVYSFDIFPTRCNFTQFIYFWKTALHVSGSIFTHHQEHTQMYLQYLVLVNCNG